MNSASLWLGTIIADGHGFDGSWRPLSAQADAREPGTGEVIGKVAVGNASDIARACAQAKEAQKGWVAGGPDQRAAVLRAAAAAARQHFDEIVSLLVRESGSTTAKAAFEMGSCITALEHSAAMATEARGLVLPSEPGRISIARRLPLGVVGVISPFNFPLYLAMRAIAPALAVGNAVVLKPDLRTAISGGVVIAKLFEEAGLPAGLFQMVPGGSDAGAALCEADGVDMIQFTGSTAVGRKVGELAGRALKKVSLELGGKNALIVLDDADVDLAVANASWGSFLHQGQICMASGRIFVQEPLATQFAEKLAVRARALHVGQGDSAPLGPLIGEGQRRNVETLVQAAVDGGAQLLAGGTGAQGDFYPPTVLAGVTTAMPAYREEIFGPVGVVVPFAKDEDVIEMANDTEFGLSAGLITRSINRALAIAEKLRVGLLHINDQTVADEVVNPFGGFGASGNGTSIGGPANWEEFTQWQWLTIKGQPPAYPL